MKRFAPITIFLAVLSGVFLKGDFGHGIIVGCLVVFVGGLLALFMALWALLSLKRSGSIPHALMRTFFIVAILGCGVLLSLATGIGTNRWEIQRTRAFVAAIIPKLDAYRAQNGRRMGRFQPHFGMWASPGLRLYSKMATATPPNRIISNSSIGIPPA
jgi:hypothetical protein